MLLNNNFDKKLKKMGEKHPGILPSLVECIRGKIDNPDALNFSGEVVVTPSQLEKIFRDFGALACAKSQGHEFRAHIINNFISALRIFEEYAEIDQAFSETEKLEVILSCLLHDTGRFVEDSWALDSKKSLFVMPALVGSYLFGDINLPENFFWKIIYDIGSPSSRPTPYRTANAVHQCDREELFGPTTVARDLAFDVGLKGGGVAIPVRDSYRRELPHPETPEYEDFLIQMEFLGRYVYPPTSPAGVLIRW